MVTWKGSRYGSNFDKASCRVLGRSRIGNPLCRALLCSEQATYSGVGVRDGLMGPAANPRVHGSSIVKMWPIIIIIYTERATRWPDGWVPQPPFPSSKFPNWSHDFKALFSCLLTLAHPSVPVAGAPCYPIEQSLPCSTFGIGTDNLSYRITTKQVYLLRTDGIGVQYNGELEPRCEQTRVKTANSRSTPYNIVISNNH